MANLLLTWELGGGQGHLVRLRTVARAMIDQGHRVFAALKDLSRARQAFDGVGVHLLQAPFMPRRVAGHIDLPQTFAHILHNVGFGDPPALAAITEAWRHLYDYVRPDLVIFDHSPTALLAARGLSTKRAVIGTGFCCPPDIDPLPNLRPGMKTSPERLQDDTARVLGAMNERLAAWSEPSLNRVTQMYSEVDATFLTTFAELDHYPGRQGAEYWGAMPHAPGKPPVWPDAPGKRVYGYLKPFKALPKLLETLNRLRQPTIICSDGVGPAVQERFTSSTLRFENQRLDLTETARQCDLAILNGTHATSISLLLAGKPSLQVPLFLEQALFARAVIKLGAGLVTPPDQPERISEPLSRLLNDEQYRTAAERFAALYADFDAEKRLDEMIRRVEQLLAAA